MKQYLEIKEQHRDAILFFRLGDFYEMFFEDAQIAAEELDITLTARGRHAGEPIPLAGVPYHSYKGYAARLLKKGYKIAICEQVEDPGKARGLVKRGVTRILTPGTVIDDGFLDETAANYLLCVNSDGDGWALAWCDVSAGEAHVTCVYGAEAAERIVEEAIKLAPSEIIGLPALADSRVVTLIKENLSMPEAAMLFDSDRVFAHPKGVAPFFSNSDVPLRLKREPLMEKTLALLAGYVGRTQGDAFEHFRRVKIHDLNEHMGLDPATVRNLELLGTIMGNERKGSLLWVLDRTVTAMGARLLRYWLLRPLTRRRMIEDRLNMVERLKMAVVEREAIRKALRQVYDIPRIVSRISTGRANARDLVALRSTLEVLPGLGELCESAGVAKLSRDFCHFDGLAGKLGDALRDNPPLTIQEGGIIAEGYSEELDRLLAMSRDAKGWLEGFQEQERARSGIKSLKVKYNKVFGYFIEITRANLASTPEDYERKQTLVGCERFITEELKRVEKEILSAQERSRRLEYELFVGLRKESASWAGKLQEAAAGLAELDCFCSLAECAEIGRYVRPRFSDGSVLKIIGGRHPVVEKIGNLGTFVPNDTVLDGDEKQVVILTGPNMSGKSTYLRQAALIVLMAQLGSFVPATEVEMAVVDKIFTRVGAGDDLTRGQSTFMVEMKETANILANATPRSLIILDEVGRGTSTYDGLSLAWAIVEYINQVPERKAKTLFATHYHELTEMADIFRGIVNLSVLVEERGDDVLFLHRIVNGAAGRSYGIHVARLAGFPERVIQKANEVLYELERDEQRDIERKRLKETSRERRRKEAVQLSLFALPETSPVLEELRRLDPERITPLDALATLARWRKMV